MIIVLAVTLASMLPGPIAKVSLRVTQTVQTNRLQVLQKFKDDGAEGNLCGMTQ